MKFRLYGQSLNNIAAFAITSALAVATLAGCGASNNFTDGAGTDTAVASLSGIVHGGPNPVNGATVTLYATKTTASPSSSNNYGYGVAGTVLGTTTTNSTGYFSFSSPATCTAGQQAYIVAGGGHTGSNSTNNAAVLMAALGPCSSLVEGSSGTVVVINEATTIAAAYALSGFMTTTGNGSSAVVNISAPANNNAATAACTVTSNVTTACAASGLAHAFLNAANLVNTTTGVVRTSITSGASVTVTVPQMLINTLANTVEACVNSSGTITGTTAPCAILMNNTTPTEVSSPTAPTNTLQALLDLAQYPSMANGCPTASATPPVLCAAGAGSGPPIGATAGEVVPSAATTALFNLANSNAYYAPALTAAPDDFTIAIQYVFQPTAGTSSNVWGLGTDIKDDIYAYATGAPITVYSLTSNGAQNWATATGTGGGCGTTAYRCAVITDTIGNVWVADSSGLTSINASTGALGTTYTTGDKLHVALPDLGNNIWLASYSVGTQTGASALEELPRGASAIVEVPVAGAPETATGALHDLAFDSAGNLWSASDSTGGGGLGALLIISSNNSLSAPAFAYTATSNPALYLGGGGAHSWAPMIDGSGNAWVISETELNEIPSSGSETGGAPNYASSYTLTYGPTWEAGVARLAFMDGDGKMIVDAASTGAGYLSVYYPNAPSDNDAGTGLGGADVYLNPCYIASSTTTCAALTGGQSTTVNVMRGVAVDSSGAIWAAFAAGSDVLQVLGPGAPTWSQRSWLPKALAPNLTPAATSLRPF